MRDVAKRAGISLAALQYHYQSKDALIAGFVETKLDEYRKEVGSIRSTSKPTAELRSLIAHAVGQTLDKQTGDVFAMLEARSRPRSSDRPSARRIHAVLPGDLQGRPFSGDSQIFLCKTPNLPPQRIVAMIERPILGSISGERSWD